MAALHAAFWGWRDEIGLTPLANRYLAMAPAVATAEATLGSTAPIPPLLAMGWSRLPSVAPALAALVLPLLDDLTALLTALGQVPHTFVHGDWKAGNLGEHPDGRTILIDWGQFPGEASPLADLTWYLASNAARLPESKDDTIATYRRALEGHGVATSGWWDGAVALELLATMVQFGWEKALTGRDPSSTDGSPRRCAARRTYDRPDQPTRVATIDLNLSACTPAPEQVRIAGGRQRTPLVHRDGLGHVRGE